MSSENLKQEISTLKKEAIQSKEEKVTLSKKVETSNELNTDIANLKDQLSSKDQKFKDEKNTV